MALNLGPSPVSDLFVGTVRPQELRLGVQLVWPIAGFTDIIDGGASSPAWTDWYSGGTASFVPTDTVNGGSSAA